jgi:hypothetical protein
MSSLARSLYLVASLAALSGRAQAADPTRCEARSGPHVPAVVELYTSEGCNSCPPADRWLSGLKGRGDVLALAFHVDYWDRLGWADRFASPAFTRRQHAVQKSAGQGFVYTPQVLLNGRDWRGWDGSRLSAAETGRRASVVQVQLVRDAGVVKARVVPLAGAPAVLGAYWAGIEDGHVSAVRNGENAGVTLHHDGVVRSYLEVPNWQAAGPRELVFASPAAGEGGRPRRAVLVVTDGRSGLPVQAVALACSG